MATLANQAFSQMRQNMLPSLKTALARRKLHCLMNWIEQLNVSVYHGRGRYRRRSAEKRTVFTILGRFWHSPISQGLVLYVRAKIGSTIHIVNRNCCMSLLDLANTALRYPSERGGIHLPMLDFFLGEGVDPNEEKSIEIPEEIPASNKDSKWNPREARPFTPWKTLLNFLSLTQDGDMYVGGVLPRADLPLLDACKLFIFHGAKN
jgi:hypothetical protein